MKKYENREASVTKDCFTYSSGRATRILQGTPVQISHVRKFTRPTLHYYAVLDTGESIFLQNIKLT